MSTFLVSFVLAEHLQDFIDCLKDRLLQRIHDVEFSGEEITFTDAKRKNVTISHNVIYEHKTLAINYTTYDV